ncbi:MAG TPA: hypothetical protein VEK86_00425 [Gemmatimonadales bacterium]|nr:hypothetical protein [Gemmatimonadales bacterium]
MASRADRWIRAAQQAARKAKGALQKAERVLKAAVKAARAAANERGGPSPRKKRRKR